MRERGEGLLAGSLLGAFLATVLLVGVEGGLAGFGASPVFPLSSKSNFGITISIYHEQNGTLDIVSDKLGWLPVLTASGNEDFGIPVGYCKVIILLFYGLHIQMTSHMYAISRDSAVCGQ